MPLVISPTKDPNEEIEKIFKKLFWNFDKIWITPLTPGYSGAGVYIVTPDLGPALARPVVAKIGLKEKIQEEEKNYNKYVKWLSGMRSTILMASAYSDSLGGIVYSLIGNLMDGRIISFEDYYKENNIDAVEEGVEKLFTETCKYWYLRIDTELENTLEIYIKDLSLDLFKLRQIYDELFSRFILGNKSIVYKMIATSKKVSNSSNTFDIINAAEWVSTYSLRTPLATRYCITHGDFNKNNIVFDNRGDPWLIDFMFTGKSCALRDFIRLETTIKFELLNSNINELSYFNFDNALINDMSNQSTNFSTNPAELEELEKAFRAIKKIRALAADRVPADGINYDIGLLIQTIKFLSWNKCNNKNFILISAGLLCVKLDNSGLFRG